MAVTEITKILFRRGRENDRRSLESFGGLAQGEPGFTSGGSGQLVQEGAKDTHQLDSQGNFRAGFLHIDDVHDITVTPNGGGDLFMGGAGQADVFIGGTSSERHWQRYFVSLYGTRKNTTFTGPTDANGTGSDTGSDEDWGYINGTFHIGTPGATAADCENNESEPWDVKFYGYKMADTGAGENLVVGTQSVVHWDASVGKLAVMSDGAMTMPNGTKDQRPAWGSNGGTATNGTAVVGDLRFNTELNAFEGFTGTEWTMFGGGFLGDDGKTTYITTKVMSDDDGVTGAGWLADGANEINFVANSTHVAEFTNTQSSFKREVEISSSQASVAAALTTDRTTFNLIDDTATTINFGGEATNVQIGDGGTSSSVTINGTTTSTTRSTGALIVAGGCGIAGALNVGGDITAFQTSDSRLKDDVAPIQDALSKVNKLQGVQFKWNEQAPGWTKEKQNGLQDVGVLAQDVEQVLPEAVVTRDDGYKAVDYQRLVPLLIQAVNDLSQQVEKLSNKQ